MVLLGKRIKELRTKYNLTQIELAERLGVSKATIASYEGDLRLPSYEVLIKMSNVFKVTIDSLLLNRDEDMVDVSGLTSEQKDKIESLISYFRKCELIDAFYSKEPIDYDKLKEKYPDFFENNENIDFFIRMVEYNRQINKLNNKNEI